MNNASVHMKQRRLLKKLKSLGPVAMPRKITFAVHADEVLCRLAYEAGHEKELSAIALIERLKSDCVHIKGFWVSYRAAANCAMQRHADACH